MYSNMVTSLDQWYAQCEIAQSAGKCRGGDNIASSESSSTPDLQGTVYYQLL